ncbi:MAG TPA: GGDEF domain-containing protein [Candidatus Elarobacter sp.]|nr:GGDEF domain-containing protein [Candidatus Elarobacter sp.]
MNRLFTMATCVLAALVAAMVFRAVQDGDASALTIGVLALFVAGILLVAVVRGVERPLREAVAALRETTVRKDVLESEHERLVHELELGSRSDYVTGLLNRRAFVETALHEIANAKRYGRPFTVVMFDVDDFKHVNERYGRDAGDAVLAAIAGAAEGEFRAGDLVCRYGGDEFAVFAPECGADDARVLTERVRRAVESLDVAGRDGVALRVTSSFGAVAVDAGAAADLDAVIAQAGEALERAKADGRNRVTVEMLRDARTSWTAGSG